MRWTPVTLICLVVVHANVVWSAEWATLRGRIVYDGTAPVPAKITPDKDVEVCGKYDLIDESLLVNPKNGGVRDVIVRLTLGRTEPLVTHPSYAKDEQGEVLLENKCCRFEPHVTVMRTTQKLVIHNTDPKGDSVKIDLFKNGAINVTLPTGARHVQEFPVAERAPARVSCSIHPWELGWLVISDHPYVGVSDEDGKFEIKNLPAGRHSFMFWQEKSGYLAEVTVNGKAASWRRGTTEIDLKLGENDLGSILVKPSLFED